MRTQGDLEFGFPCDGGGYVRQIRGRRVHHSNGRDDHGVARLLAVCALGVAGETTAFVVSQHRGLEYMLLFSRLVRSVRVGHPCVSRALTFYRLAIGLGGVCQVFVASTSCSQRLRETCSAPGFDARCANILSRPFNSFVMRATHVTLCHVTI